MAQTRFDRSPSLVEMKPAFVRILLPYCCRNIMYKRIKNLKAEINKKSKQSPGVVSRKPTLVEFCKYFDLPVDESSHILNNRFLERIIIAEGPFKNQPD